MKHTEENIIMAYFRDDLFMFVNKNLIIFLPHCHGGSNKIKGIQKQNVLENVFSSFRHTVLYSFVKEFII